MGKCRKEAVVLNSNHAAVPIEAGGSHQWLHGIGWQQGAKVQKRALFSSRGLRDIPTNRAGLPDISLTNKQQVALEMACHSLILQNSPAGMRLHSPVNLPLMTRLNREGHTMFWSGSQQNEQPGVTSPHWTHWVGCDWFQPWTAGHSAVSII